MSADPRTVSKVAADIATYNAVLEEARDEWDDWAVDLGGYLGGADPKTVRANIETNAKRAEVWKARGAALSAGHPLDVDGDPTNDAVKLDNIDLWTDMGNVLLSELQIAAHLRSSVGLDNATWYTTKKTAETVGEGVAELAETAADVGGAVFSWRKPLVWFALAVGSLILLVNVGALSALGKLKRQGKALLR